MFIPPRTFQIHPNVDGKYVTAEFFLSYNGQKISWDDFQDCHYWFLVIVKNSSVWKVEPSALEPVNIVKSSSLFYRSELKTFLTDDEALEMRIEVVIKSSRLTKNLLIQPNDSLNLLSENLKLALETEEFKDVKLIIDKKEFTAHKAILAARSLVFKKMFVSNMKEARTNIVYINDIKAEIFEEMLRFIYTGKVSEYFQVFALELFEAAHKYEIEDLMEICKNAISENLSDENAADFLNMAVVYDFDENLKKEAFSLLKQKLCNKIESFQNSKSNKDVEGLTQIFQSIKTQNNSEKK